MAIDSKIDFLREAETALAESVTASDMTRIMKVLSDVLEGYDMRCIVHWDDGPDDLLDCYLSAMDVECRSQKTIDRYRYVISRMMQYVKVPTRRVTVYHLRSYIAAEKARGISDMTLKGYREIFCAYFNWLQRENLIEQNPTSNLGTIKCAKKEKKIYSEIDIEKLNQCCESVRDRAIINFLGSTGCRVSEMIELDRSAINLESLECVVHGKGNKERIVYMSEITGMLLREYLAQRQDDNPALFVNRYFQRLHTGGVRAMLKRIAEAAHVDKVHPHKFRRTLATNLSRHGMQIQEVAAILGHEKLDTTMKYVVLNKDEIRNSYRRYT